VTIETSNAPCTEHCGEKRGEGSERHYRCAYVVVTYNSAAHVDRCLSALDKFVGGTERDVIVVVDNASSDETLEKLASHRNAVQNLRVLPLSRNIGFGPANNRAFDAIDAQYYVLVNHDAWLVADSVRPAIDAMKADSTIAIVGLPLVFPDGSSQTYAYPFSSWRKWFLQIFGVSKAVRGIINVPFAKQLLRGFSIGREFVDSHARAKLDLDNVDISRFGGSVRDVDWVCGAAMVLRGDFVRNTGGFDPNLFLYGEDEDLCLDAYRRGRRVVAVDAVPVVHHFGWGDNRTSPVVARLKFESLGYFIRKNIRSGIGRVLMNAMLPVYVYGWNGAMRKAFRGKL